MAFIVVLPVAPLASAGRNVGEYLVIGLKHGAQIPLTNGVTDDSVDSPNGHGEMVNVIIFPPKAAVHHINVKTVDGVLVNKLDYVTCTW